MSKRCTCGALPPEDALFCHKCGRPMVEMVVPEVVETLAPPLVGEPAQQSKLGEGLGGFGGGVAQDATADGAGINFHNRYARRAALLAAPAAIFVLTIPLPGFLGLIWQFFVLMGSGVLTYTLYARWSGESLTPRNGARLGWLTGILTFVIFLVMATFLITFLMLNPSVFGEMVKQMQTMGVQDPNLQELQTFQKNPQNVAGGLLVLLPIFFILFTLPAGLGGALGARWFGRKP